MTKQNAQFRGVMMNWGLMAGTVYAISIISGCEIMAHMS